MKPANHAAILLMLVIMVSCGKPVKSVLGDWLWVETSGGLLPPVTPENSGQTARLSLSKDYWTFYENGQQTERLQIKIRRRSSGLIIDTDIPNGDKVIEFLSDDEITVTFYGGPNTDCQDCTVRRFVRVKDN